MKTCEICGAQLHDSDTYCPSCGSNLKSDVKDLSSHLFFYRLVSLIIPLLGFILYFMIKDTRPRAAKASLRWALFGLFVYVALAVLLFLFYLFILVGILS
jgi:uncharacterized membrane protein